MCAENYRRRYRPAARHPEMIDSATSHIGFRGVIRLEKAGAASARTCGEGGSRCIPSVMELPANSRRDGRSRRNKTYVATHQTLIEAAVRLISAKGIEALSVAELARSVEMNRATVYYHFASREQLLEAVSEWSSQQLALGFEGGGSQRERIDFIARFVLANPDLIKLWFDQLTSGDDIRKAYPRWDELVSGTKRSGVDVGGTLDAEVYCTLLLTGAIIGPLVFRNSVCPDLADDAIIERFRAEQQRMLRRDGLLRE